MGKTTGFMDYQRKTSAELGTPLRGWSISMNSTSGCPGRSSRPRRPAAWTAAVPFCQAGMTIRRGGLGLPAQQPHPRVERAGLPGQVGAGPPPPAGHQPLPRVHQPGLPRPVRGRLHLRGRHRQRRLGAGERTRHHRAGLCQGLDAGLPASHPHRQERGGHRLGPCGALGGRIPQQAGAYRHHLRAGGPPRRPSDVRHPQYEAG